MGRPQPPEPGAEGLATSYQWRPSCLAAQTARRVCAGPGVTATRNREMDKKGTMCQNGTMPVDPLYYRLGGGDLDHLFEEAYGKWIVVPLAKLDIPAGVLQWHATRINLRDRLLSAAQRRCYSLRVQFDMAGDDCLGLMIKTAHSKYRPQPPRHLTG